MAQLPELRQLIVVLGVHPLDHDELGQRAKDEHHTARHPHVQRLPRFQKEKELKFHIKPGVQSVAHSTRPPP